MTYQSTIPKEIAQLKQLLGEWSVGVAVKLSNDKILSGCGEMSAVELGEDGINSEINMHLEGYEDYYENDLWSFDRKDGKVHLFGITSEGLAHDHVGVWRDEATLELHWQGTFEDQELEEHVTLKWVSKDHFEVEEINSKFGKPTLSIDYVFKRKEI